jgi:hypothetical protein
MNALQIAVAAPVKMSMQRARWLPILEKEIKRRVGWADEAISPFARGVVRKEAAVSPSPSSRAAASIKAFIPGETRDRSDIAA